MIISRPRETGVIVSRLGSDDFLDLKSEAYPVLLDRVYSEIKTRFSNPKYCQFFSSDNAVAQKLNKEKGALSSTENLSEIGKGLIHKIHIAQTTDIKGLEDLCQMILPQIERKFYGTYVIAKEAMIYRSLESVLPPFGSFLWHSDNDFDDTIKVMFYLSDVSEDNAPFEYLHNPKFHRSPRIRANIIALKKYTGGRIPEEAIEEFEASGCEKHKVIGGRGTVVVFDNKIIHRGNIAKKGFRDVLVLHLMPSVFKPKRYIDPRWTASV